MQDNQRFFLAEFLQFSTGEAQRQAIEQSHDEADHDRVAFQAQLDEVGDALRIGDRFGNGLELSFPNLKMEIRIDLNILEPVRLPPAR